MSQINNVEREHDIRQVSRLDDLKPATEKSISNIPRNIGSESANSPVNNVTNPVFQAARQAGIESIRHTRNLTEESEKREDQEAIDKLEASSKTAALDAKEALRSQIRKKRSHIKNTKDIRSGTRTIRKADRSVKNATETTRLVVKSTTEAAKEAAIASQKVASARKTEQVAKKAAEWVKRIVKGIIEASKRLGAALGAAAVPLLLILVLASLIAGIVSSSFGIFFSGSSGKESKSLQSVVLDINNEFNAKIDKIKANTKHDELVMKGTMSSWPDVLSVYAVYVTTKPENATDVVHITDEHIKMLRNIFWQMNTVTSSTTKKTETKKEPVLDENGNQKKDEKGNPVYTEKKITKTTLHIKISHKDADEEAKSLSFTAKQLEELNELLSDKYASLWSQILIGVGTGSDKLVTIALSQLGNKGGEKYWRWAGSSKRIPWCALFVSWCGEQAGLRSAGKVPYFSFVGDGVHWFKTKGKWIKGSDVTSSNYDELIRPGMIIFFDWLEDGKRDGHGDHVGIVTKVANGRIYTVEGNNNDYVAKSSYPVGSKSILGFGIVA